MMPVLFAGLSAIVWGTADYCGGRATRRMSGLTVTVTSQTMSVPLLIMGLFLMPGTLVVTDLIWGAMAGIAGLLGLVALYQGLSTGAMAVVAPITAVTGALIPMAVGLATEQAPSAVALAGAGCAVVAIALVSLGHSDPQARPHRRVVGTALGAGALFGIFFSLLGQVHDESGLWPLVAARCLAILVGLLIVARTAGSLRVPRTHLGWVAAAGVGDVLANGFFLLAAREGLLSVVAPIAALYPVTTVLLALVVDEERVRPVQIAGLGLAASALVLTAF